MGGEGEGDYDSNSNSNDSVLKLVLALSSQAPKRPCPTAYPLGQLINCVPWLGSHGPGDWGQDKKEAEATVDLRSFLFVKRHWTLDGKWCPEKGIFCLSQYCGTLLFTSVCSDGHLYINRGVSSGSPQRADLARTQQTGRFQRSKEKKVPPLELSEGAR